MKQKEFTDIINIVEKHYTMYGDTTNKIIKDIGEYYRKNKDNLKIIKVNKK